MSKLLYLAINFVPHKSFEKYENNHQYRKQRESLYIQQNGDSNIYFLQQQHRLLESKKQDA